MTKTELRDIIRKLDARVEDLENVNLDNTMRDTTKDLPSRVNAMKSLAKSIDYLEFSETLDYNLIKYTLSQYVFHNIQDVLVYEINVPEKGE